MEQQLKNTSHEVAVRTRDILLACDCGHFRAEIFHRIRYSPFPTDKTPWEHGVNPKWMIVPLDPLEFTIALD